MPNDDNVFSNYSITKNTKDRWFKLDQEVNVHINSGAGITSFQVDVSVGSDISKPDSDVLNLQYFFPIADRIHDIYHIIPVLNVIDNTEKFQARQYLLAQSFNHDQVKITVNGGSISVSSQQRFGRLIPLLKVDGKRRGSESFYSGFMDDRSIRTDTINRLSDIYSAYQEYVEARRLYENNKIKISELLSSLVTYQTNVDAHPLSSDRLRKNIAFALKKLKNGSLDFNNYLLSMSRLFYTDREARVFDLARNICLGNIVFMMEKIRGSKEEKYDDKEKNELIGKLLNYLSQKMTGLPLLAQLIWSVILRFLVEQKDITERINNDLMLRANILEKSFCDAVAYSEGVIQLIENACIHTERGVAYLNIRTYFVNRDAPIKDLSHNVDTLVRLSGKYHFIKYDFKKDVDFYLELIVLDDSFSHKNKKAIGIRGKYNSVHQGQKELETLTEVFEKEADEKDTDQIINHYGLQLFKKIVVVNDGCFICASPETSDGKSVRYAKKKNHLPICEPDEGFCGTEYNILLPIKYQWEQESRKITSAYQELFDTDILKDSGGEYNCLVCRPNAPKEYHHASEKIEAVEALSEELSQQLGHSTGNTLFVIDSEKYSYTNIELLAKALFQYLSRINGISLRVIPFAVFFREKSHINEFIRIFSIFYDKFGNRSVMGKVQIALCSFNDNDDTALSSPEVNFLIAGKNILSARKSAQIFAYYHSEASLAFIPQINYLTRTVEDLEKMDTPAQFPFDLYLKTDVLNHADQEREPDGQISFLKNPEKIASKEISRSWFLQRIHKILHEDVRGKTFGCKISDVHISLSSVIHIDTFYEAELLFHNIGNVYRFAFLCAREIFKDYRLKKRNERIIIVSYENYSSTLVQEISRIVSKILVVETDYIVFSNEKDGNQPLSERDKKKVLPEAIHSERDKKATFPEVICYVVLPIGSTMQTIYMIRKSIRQVIPKERDIHFGKNLCILAVGNTTAEITDNEKAIRVRYWNSVSNNNITLTKFEKDSDGISVHYFLAAGSTWYDPTNCKLCNENKVLIEVDATSTIPNMIFELYGSNRESITTLIEEPNENDRRLDMLKHCIIYSHTYRNDNHFQYYLDFLKYFEIANPKEKEKEEKKNKENETITEWLRNQRERIDQEAFNIVISPLHETNSPFLKAVIDNAFEHSIRFLHIPINNSYKEDIRAKFKYISEEFGKMRRFDAKAKLNIYFVDDSIVSGQTLNRGRKLIRMLLEEAKTPYEDCALFKGVFLLVNRCSFDTIRSFVKDPRGDFFAYLHVAVPSYNTHSDLCPACRMAERYELIQKRSASGRLSAEYQRLADKHRKKSRYYYKVWLAEKILVQHGYLGLLKNWLYYNAPDETSGETASSAKLDKPDVEGIRDVEEFVRSVLKKTNIDSARMRKTTLDEFICSYIDQTLTKCSDEEKDKKRKELRGKSIVIVRDYIIAEQSFMRLKSTHDAYCKLEGISKRYVPGKDDIIVETRKAIMDLIDERFEKENRNYLTAILPQRERTILVEWLISMIKVISRDQLAKFYHIRQAISDIMLELVHGLINDPEGYEGADIGEDVKRVLRVIIGEESPGKANFENNLAAPMQYQLFRTLIRRLSGLQSIFVVKKENKRKVIDFWCRLEEKYQGTGKYENFYMGKEKDDFIKNNELPPIDDMIFDYIKLIKFTSMSSDDNSKDFVIESENKSDYDGGVV